jgi:hypothetical protein
VRNRTKEILARADVGRSTFCTELLAAFRALVLPAVRAALRER